MNNLFSIKEKVGEVLMFYPPQFSFSLTSCNKTTKFLVFNMFIFKVLQQGDVRWRYTYGDV